MLVDRSKKRPILGPEQNARNKELQESIIKLLNGMSYSQIERTLEDVLDQIKSYSPINVFDNACFIDK